MSEGSRHSILRCLWVPGDFLVLRDPGTLLHPYWHSSAWFCPSCGEVWLREFLPDANSWEVVSAPCASCSDPYQESVPGSIVLPTRYPLETFSTLPPALARQEATLLLRSPHG